MSCRSNIADGWMTFEIVKNLEFRKILMPVYKQLNVNLLNKFSFS